MSCVERAVRLVFESERQHSERPVERSHKITTVSGDRAHRPHVSVADDQSNAFKRKSSEVAATLKLTHKAIGAEVRRGMNDIVVEGQPAGSLKMNDTIEITIEPGRHTLQVRNGRNSSQTETFDAAEGIPLVLLRLVATRFPRSWPTRRPGWCRSLRHPELTGLRSEVVVDGLVEPGL
jgi:hypothetical protein